MVSIRRKLGAFVVALAIAAAMIAAPAPVHAKAKGGDTLGAFCTELASAINYIAGLESNLVTDLVLQSLNATYTAYCQ